MYFSETDIERIKQRVDLIEVARWLGLHVGQPKNGVVKILCPIHDESTPSFNINTKTSKKYSNTYHCYGCGAHGDAISLVCHQRGVDFIGALKWLAEKYNITPTDTTSKQKLSNKRLGMECAVLHLHRSKEKELTDIFAQERNYPSDFLSKGDVYVASLEALVGNAQNDEALLMSLKNAGLLHLPPSTPSTFFKDAKDRISGFYRGKRAVFILRDIKGKPVGLAARDLAHNVKSYKYLYSHDFPKNNTLYRADTVLQRIHSEGQTTEPFILYIVEGLLDALRLEYLGFSSVAILGSIISNEHIHILKTLYDLCSEKGRELQLQIFLDSDLPGRKGAYETLLRLMKHGAKDGAVCFDIFEGIKVLSAPNSDNIKIDPDAFLKDTNNYHEACDKLEELLSEPAAEYLYSYHLKEGNDNQNRRFQIQRILHTQLAESWEIYGEDLKKLARIAPREGINPTGSPTSSDTTIHRKQQRKALFSAFSIAHSSMRKHEYPMDEMSWARMELSISVFIEAIIQLVSTNHNTQPFVPYQTALSPKQSGKMRVKAGPGPEDATLQHYVLMELLQDTSEEIDYERHIPAVRYSSKEGVYTTGLHKITRKETVSFAYQVDMDVLCHRALPGRSGIFRHYYDCWKSYISYLQGKLDNIAGDMIYIRRLDVAGFYDHLSRSAVRSALGSGPIN